jgi:hypothetical protein
MDISNRLAGAIDALAVSDGEAGLAHIFDAFFVLVHWAAEMDTVRRASETNNDVLLRRRRLISAGAPTSGPNTELMYALGKKEQAQNNFFRTTGSNGQQALGPHTQPATLPQIVTPIQLNPYGTVHPQGLETGLTLHGQLQDSTLQGSNQLGVSW